MENIMVVFHGNDFIFRQFFAISHGLVKFHANPIGMSCEGHAVSTTLKTGIHVESSAQYNR